jgi:hypothetical protein
LLKCLTLVIASEAKQSMGRMAHHGAPDFCRIDLELELRGAEGAIP